MTDYSAALKFANIEESQLNGMRVLDCGAGLGHLAVWLAMKGAHVTAIDVSPKSLEVLLKRALHHGVSQNIAARLLPIEQIDYENASFDLAVGEFILHHVMLDKCMPQIRPGAAAGGKRCSSKPAQRIRCSCSSGPIIGAPGHSEDAGRNQYPPRRATEYIDKVFEGG
jgi:2-polyprenyl-3-methyl-5-hydroxy-6-metoxy-1,4-benzoquinol methylase